jgi:hypothetical protein
VYAPDRHRDVVGGLIAACGLRGELASGASRLGPAAASRVHTEVRADHNIAILTIEEAGDDIVDVVVTARRLAFDEGIDVFYADLALEDERTEPAGDLLDDVGLTFAGVFPNARVVGDVLRLQTCSGQTFTEDDVATASDHGAELLRYVLADAARSAAG